MWRVMLIFKSRFCVSFHRIHFILVLYSFLYSITPPPEKALELPKEWIAIGSTNSDNLPTGQQVDCYY